MAPAAAAAAAPSLRGRARAAVPRACVRRVFGEPGGPAKAERAVDQRLVAADRDIGADLEVGPAQLVLDLLVPLLDPVPDAVEAHDLGQLAAGQGLSFSRGPPGRARFVTRYQVALSGKVPGSAVATTRRRTPSGPHPPRLASAAYQVSACPSRKVLVTGLPVAGIIRPAPGQGPGGLHGGVSVRGAGPGPAMRPQRHHERQPGLRQLGAEPVLVPVGAVRDHRAEREPRRPRPDRQLSPDHQLGPELRVVLPLREVLRRGVRHRVHRVVDPLISPHRGDGDHAVVGLAVPAQVLPAHVRGRRAVLAVPESSITSTPPPCGAVAGSARSSPSRRSLTRSGSHTDSDKKNCSRCTAGSFDPVTGSAPARAVSVLFRSRGASSPARYSAEPPPLRHMREQVIETGPRTPPADPAQADTLSAWSSLITGFELTRKPTLSLPLTSLDPTDYR